MSLYWIFVKYHSLYGAIVSWKGWDFNGISRWWIEIKLDLSHRDFEQLPLEFAYFSIVFLKNVLAKQWKIWIVKGIARNKAFTVNLNQLAFVSPENMSSRFRRPKTQQEESACVQASVPSNTKSNKMGRNVILRLAKESANKKQSTRAQASISQTLSHFKMLTLVSMTWTPIRWIFGWSNLYFWVCFNCVWLHASLDILHIFRGVWGWLLLNVFLIQP